MSLLNAFKIVKDEGMKTFGHVLKEKLAERKDDNYRYWQIIKTTEKSIKDSYKDVTELDVDLIDLTNIRERLLPFEAIIAIFSAVISASIITISFSVT